MATKKGFMDLPAELRNQIYEDYIAITKKDQTIKLENLNKTNCATTCKFALALGLKEVFPLIFASNKILHEALSLCLRTCNVRLANLGHLVVMDEVQHFENFRKGMAQIRTLTLDLAFPDVRPPYGLFDTPLLMRFPCAALLPSPPISRIANMPLIPSQEFEHLLVQSQSNFPNISTIRVELDGTTIRLHAALQGCLPSVEWPSLREVKVRRPDLECRLARSEYDIFGSRHSRCVWPPERIPWRLEMDMMFLDTVNEALVEILRKSAEEN